MIIGLTIIQIGFTVLNVINAIKEKKKKSFVAINVINNGESVIKVCFTVINAINAIEENKNRSIAAINVISNG